MRPGLLIGKSLGLKYHSLGRLFRKEEAPFCVLGMASMLEVEVSSAAPGDAGHEERAGACKSHR
jgi:hypothetical protein